MFVLFSVDDSEPVVKVAVVLKLHVEVGHGCWVIDNLIDIFGRLGGGD